MINGQTNKVTATITVGRAPAGVAVNPLTGAVYVANADTGSGNTV